MYWLSKLLYKKITTMKKIIFIFIALFIITVYQDSSAQIFFRTGVNTGVTLPTQDFNEMFNTQLGSEVYLAYPVSKTNLEVTISIGYSRFQFDNEFVNNKLKALYGPGETVPVLDVNANFSTTPLLIGARYTLPKGIIRPFVSLEGGLHFVSFDIVNGTINIPQSGTIFIPKERRTETKFGGSLGAGFIYPIEGVFDVELVGKYNYMDVNFEQDYDIVKSDGTRVRSYSSSKGTYFTLKAGISFWF